MELRIFAHYMLFGTTNSFIFFKQFGPNSLWNSWRLSWTGLMRFTTSLRLVQTRSKPFFTHLRQPRTSFYLVQNHVLRSSGLATLQNYFENRPNLFNTLQASIIPIQNFFQSYFRHFDGLKYVWENLPEFLNKFKPVRNCLCKSRRILNRSEWVSKVFENTSERLKKSPSNLELFPTISFQARNSLT